MTDMTSLQCALFAIVYRYVMRSDVAENKNLGDGVLWAFVICRSLTAIHVPNYCMSAPLDCGGIGYIFDLNEGTAQLVLVTLSSYVAFAATKTVLDRCFTPSEFFGLKWIKRFDE